MTRLTDEELADVAHRVAEGVCHLCRNGKHRGTCSACHGTGAFSLGTGTMESVLTELIERRTADLTPFELTVLKSHRDRLNANELEDRALVALLDKLTRGGGG